MRARLNEMELGQCFCFLCVPKMAEEMDRVIERGGGVIVEKDVRSYGVVISIRKATG